MIGRLEESDVVGEHEAKDEYAAIRGAAGHLLDALCSAARHAPEGVGAREDGHLHGAEGIGAGWGGA